MYPRLERFLLGPKFACIECEIQSEHVVYHISVLHRKGEKASPETLVKCTSSVEEILELVDRRIPVALIITGRGIINRKFTGQIGLSDEALLRSVLPNASVSDLFLSRFPASEHALFVSIARKEAVLKITEQLKELSVVSIVIGPCVALTIVDLLGSVGEEFNCSNHLFRFNDRQVAEIIYRERNDPAEVILGSEKIAEENLVSFAGALQGLSHTSGIPGEAAGFSERRRNFFRMKRYGAYVKLSTLIALLVLLINLFLFTHYRNLKSKLESDPAVSASSIQEYRELKEKVLSSRDFLTASGMNNTVSIAWIADQLACKIPADIVLSKLSVSPNENYGRADTIGFRCRQIIIAGKCRESTSLNEWIKLLQALAWIGSAEITAYSDAGGKEGKFELELTVE